MSAIETTSFASEPCHVSVSSSHTNLATVGSKRCAKIQVGGQKSSRIFCVTRDCFRGGLSADDYVVRAAAVDHLWSVCVSDQQAVSLLRVRS